MKTLVASLLFLTAVNALAESVEFDRSLAEELSVAYLKAYFRYDPKQEIAPVIYKDPLIESAVDGHGRKFVFVAFKSKTGAGGATMHLEVCGYPIELQPSFYGPSLDVLKDRESFLRIAGNQTADYPGECYKYE